MYGMIFKIVELILSPLDIWLTHVWITKDREVYGFASYRKFKNEFRKHEWMIKENIYGDKLVNANKTCEIDIDETFIKFEESFMIINNPLGLFLAKNLINKKIKEITPLKEKRIYKW